MSSDEAGSVSVQTILIDPETHFTVTCRFYRTEDKSEDPINTQILSENEIPVKPQTPAASGENADKKKFLGWFREDGTEFTAEDFLKTGAQIAGKQDGNLTENVELDLFAKFSNVHYVYYKTDNGEHGRILILKPWQMVKKLYLFQKIMDTKQRWDMYLPAGPGTQSPINRTVNIRSAAQTVILSFIR